jgi:hypothetical protein
MGIIILLLLGLFASFLCLDPSFPDFGCFVFEKELPHLVKVGLMMQLV